MPEITKIWMVFEYWTYGFNMTGSLQCSINEVIILIVSALCMKWCPWVDINYIKEASLSESKVFRSGKDIINLRYIFIRIFGEVMDLDDSPYLVSYSASCKRFHSYPHRQRSFEGCHPLIAIYWETDVRQTCCIWGIWVRGSFPPQVSQLRPGCGDSQSEPGGWSGLMPPPYTPLPGTGVMTEFLGRRPDRYGPPWGGSVGGKPPLVFLSHAMLNLTVPHNRHCCNLHSAIFTLDPHPLPLPIGQNHPYNPSLIFHHQYYAVCMECLEFYAHSFPLICLQADPVKEVWNNIDLPMYPIRLGWRDESGICVKILRKFLYQCAKYLSTCLYHRYHLYPVSDDGVH